MSTFSAYNRSELVSLTDLQVATLIFDDEVIYRGMEITNNIRRQFQSASISIIREFQRRYPSEPVTFFTNLKDNILLAGISGEII